MELGMGGEGDVDTLKPGTKSLWQFNGNTCRYLSPQISFAIKESDSFEDVRYGGKPFPATACDL